MSAPARCTLRADSVEDPTPVRGEAECDMIQLMMRLAGKGRVGIGGFHPPMIDLRKFLEFVANFKGLIRVSVMRAKVVA